MAFSTSLKLISTKHGYDAFCSVKYPGIEGARLDKWYISKIRFLVNDEVVADFTLGPNVSNDPVIGIHLSDLASGDKVSVKWIDVRGLRDFAEAFVI